MTGRYGTPAAGPDEQPFEFPCPACRHMIAATSAEWCLCIVKRPSIICDRCQVCLCKADPRVTRDFWLQAPASVLNRSSEERARRAVKVSPAASTAVDVLVVDDDEEIRTVAALMLEDMGYSVLTASGPAEALDAIERRPPRLVLTDALMPKIDGRQHCRLIKGRFEDVRVVIMTSLYTAPRYKSEALKTFHADDYLAKPVNYERLKNVVARLVPQRQEIA